MNRQFVDYLETHNKGHRYSQDADLCSLELGLVLRAQRAGDRVLSRPVMVGEAWADQCGDNALGPIPQEEWTAFV
ncbi:hypothetical protein E1293_35260 [Actinomadura darangshiensis]|uniref:Uncharacterized protein n=1 Tax=Actinomadura darangshiensis TaxID=705336 RepID=A0A4R5AF64_9ACTN|nr:hypothetical protein E1293_35260 [Actinomadura darangshiensis]